MVVGQLEIDIIISFIIRGVQKGEKLRLQQDTHRHITDIIIGSLYFYTCIYIDIHIFGLFELICINSAVISLALDAVFISFFFLG